MTAIGAPQRPWTRIEADSGALLRRPTPVGASCYVPGVPRSIYYTASTLNGFLATEDDSLEWLLSIPQEDVTGDIESFIAGIGALALGSATYEWVLRTENPLERPENWTRWYADRPTFVFTSRELPTVPGVDIRFVHGDVDAHWDALAAAAGDHDLWVMGGGDLAGQFADAGHLDELVITIAPTTLTSGKPLLPRNIGWDRLTLMGVRQLGRFAELRYRVR
ncbi:dihydrofolate reductase family protein [Microbacterium sp.]|uniref:dihydrofolate reductase family protein n=1 Tax=Microbacterium sp. TaxID=51671 RepID=UPI0039E496AB